MKLIDPLTPKQRIVWLFAILLWIGVIKSFSQSVGLYQDPKLAFVGDEDAGLDVWTLALSLRVRLEGNEQKFGRMYLEPNVNVTNLTESNYWRYGVDGGYIWNTPIKNVEALTGVGIGSINRFGGSYASLSIMSGVLYHFGRLSAGARFYWVGRSDLEARWNTGGLKPNFEVGIEFKL